MIFAGWRYEVLRDLYAAATGSRRTSHRQPANIRALRSPSTCWRSQFSERYLDGRIRPLQVACTVSLLEHQTFAITNDFLLSIAKLRVNRLLLTTNCVGKQFGDAWIWQAEVFQ